MAAWRFVAMELTECKAGPAQCTDVYTLSSSKLSSVALKYTLQEGLWDSTRDTYRA